MKNSQTALQMLADRIRLRVLEHTLSSNGGYMSQACSAAELFICLYQALMKLAPTPTAPLTPPPFPGVPAPQNPHYRSGSYFNGAHAPELDRFYLSPSQYALVLYAALIEIGRMSPESLRQFNQDGSSVEMIGAEHSPGMELMTGSLGQGLAVAAGIAWARKQRGESGRNFVFMSDGEFQIGMTWEALQTARHYALSNLIIYVDVNGQQCDGTVESVMQIEPLDQRIASFGAHVISIDGNSIEQLLATPAQFATDRPTVVLCHTDPCRGLVELERRRPKLHYLRFQNPQDKEIYALAYQRLLKESKESHENS